MASYVDLFVECDSYRKMSSKICQTVMIVVFTLYISHSNMTSFIGYINNTIIKLTICFNSHMRIDEQITFVIPELVPIYRTFKTRECKNCLIMNVNYMYLNE